ncbi:YegP family protein [Pseudomonas sp. D(2018)]|uniref:YegP family protein n=1 Tax=Pseudomonadaceae TaxID=135621 RepID=UPI0014859014|nr:YegP family protein [Pseudomonas sp. D(2018)]
MSSWYEVKANSTGTFRFRLRCPEGKMLIESSTYESKNEAISAIELMSKVCANPDRYKRFIHSSGKNYFSLKDKANKEIIASHLYDSEATRDKAMEFIAQMGQSKEVKFL